MSTSLSVLRQVVVGTCPAALRLQASVGVINQLDLFKTFNIWHFV